MRKTLFLCAVILTTTFTACAKGPKIVKSEQKTRPYTVNFVYLKAEKPELTAEGENQGQTQETEKPKDSRTISIWNPEDESNLKISVLNSIESGKLFDKMNFLASKEALTQTPSDYQVLITYSGGIVISKGGLNRGLEAKLLLELELFKGSESLKRIKVTTRQESVWTEAQVKADCTENAVKGVLEFLNQIQ